MDHVLKSSEDVNTLSLEKTLKELNANVAGVVEDGNKNLLNISDQREEVTSPTEQNDGIINGNVSLPVDELTGELHGIQPSVMPNALDQNPETISYSKAKSTISTNPVNSNTAIFTDTVSSALHDTFIPPENVFVCAGSIKQDEKSSYNNNIDLKSENQDTIESKPHGENSAVHVVADDTYSSSTGMDLISSKTAHMERRFNPFNKVDSDDNLWQHKSRSLDEIEKFSESFSNHSSLPSSPEKNTEAVKKSSVSDIWEKQPSQALHNPEFEMLPAEFRQQKPVTDLSESIEDIDQAIRDVKINSHENYQPEDPWVRLEEPSPEILAPQHSPMQEVQGQKSPSLSYSRPLIDVAGPCDAEDLIEGIIFSANYLGSTQLQSERNPGKNARMLQAQEAVGRIKAPDGESQPSVEVDLFISTDKVKMLNAETQESMMDHTLRSISYIADIGNLLVVMARRRVAHSENNDEPQLMREPKPERSYRIICHVFSSPDAHLMAQAIGQAFNVAYQHFLSAHGIEPQTLTRDDYNELLDMQEMYHDDLVHYSKRENVKDVWVEKKKGEAMGIVIVESGWGSIVPTVVLANMQHGSPVERCGKLSIGDQIMNVNGTSLVGLPLTTCQSIIKGLRSQSLAHLHIVSCPPVVTVIIKRPDLKYQLGFSVQEGIICSLMRGGIAERGGVRVGHRIIEINGRSVVATPHDKIVQMLVSSIGEIQMKTMPATMYRLLTGQEQPVYI